MVKTAIIAGMDSAESRKPQIVTRCLDMLRDRNEHLTTKQQLVETLAAAVFKDYLAENKKLATSLQLILLDELNNAVIANTQLTRSTTKIDIAKVFSSTEYFE